MKKGSQKSYGLSLKGTLTWDFFCFKWFGQTNPSSLLINILKYFRFLFQIRQDIRLFVHSMYSQYTYRFIPRISVYEQIHSAYSQYTNRFIPRILSIRIARFSSNTYLPHSAYSPNTYRFIPHILSVRTDSFRVFSVYEQIHSAYSENAPK